MTSLETTLALAVVVLTGAVIILLFVSLRGGDDGVDPEHVKSAVSDAMSDLGLDLTAGKIENHASEMKQFHSDIERMLSSPQQRGAFGERQLEVILGDQLPEDMYGTQETVIGTKRPDAHIRSPEGIICIDSKFSFEEYERYLDAPEGSDEAAQHQRKFADAVDNQLAKIETDYIRPEDGTTDFAFAFIPSERVYYHLITQEYEMLRDYTTRGVQVVSPLTFGHKIELIKAGVQAKRLSEQAEDIQEQLQRLGTRFSDFEDQWETFQTHFSNASTRASGADEEFKRLRNEFDRIEEPALHEPE